MCNLIEQRKTGISVYQLQIAAQSLPVNSSVLIFDIIGALCVYRLKRACHIALADIKMDVNLSLRRAFLPTRRPNIRWRAQEPVHVVVPLESILTLLCACVGEVRHRHGGTSGVLLRLSILLLVLARYLPPEDAADIISSISSTCHEPQFDPCSDLFL